MRISDWSSDVCSSDLSLHRSRGTPPSGVRAANDIFSLRHYRQTRWQCFLLGRIAPLHDIIILHAVDARPVPPVRGGELVDIADTALAERRGHPTNDDAQTSFAYGHRS